MLPKDHKARQKNKRNSGQIMVIYGLLLPVLFLIMGLALDSGLMYLTKARLSRAVDGVALRLTRRFSLNMQDRKDIATNIMRANFSGYMPGAIAWTNSGDFSQGDSVETLVGTYGNQKITIVTEAVGADGTPVADTGTPSVVQVTVTATTRHSTFFMALANVNTVDFQETATAQRFPACNILVLDISGSMRGGNDAQLVAGVQAFVNEFVNNRDYFLVVTFSTIAKVVWPDIPDSTNGNRFLPSRGFVTNSEGGILLAPFASDSLMSVINSKVRFAGVTSAAEGVRSAFDQADQFLNLFSDSQRALIKVNYVFFTDGEFNSFRGFARGVGYGMNVPTAANAKTFTPVADTSQLNTGANLPAFHNTLPLQGSRFVNGGSLSGINFTKFSQSTGTTYDLGTLVGGVNTTNLVGINCVIQGYRERSAQWKSPYTKSTPTLTSDLATGNITSNSYYYWNNLLYKSLAGVLLPVASPTLIQAGNEAYKFKIDHGIYYPLAYPDSFQNAANAKKEYYPGGRAFTNTDYSTSDQTKAVYLERNGTGLGPDNGVTGNYDTWNYGTCRLSAFYPKYTFGGPIDFPGDNDGNGFVNENDFNTAKIGPPTQFYSFKDGTWVDCTDNSENRISLEGNWLAEAQCYLARSQHNATVYTIQLGTNTQEVKQHMANDNNGTVFYPGQPQGKYYYAQTGSELTPIFRAIAQKISVRLSQ